MRELAIESTTAYRLHGGKWGRGRLFRDAQMYNVAGFFEEIALTEFVATTEGNDLIITFHVEQLRHEEHGGQHRVFFVPSEFRVHFDPANA